MSRGSLVRLFLSVLYICQFPFPLVLRGSLYILIDFFVVLKFPAGFILLCAMIFQRILLFQDFHISSSQYKEWHSLAYRYSVLTTIVTYFDFPEMHFLLQMILFSHYALSIFSTLHLAADFSSPFPCMVSARYFKFLILSSQPVSKDVGPYLLFVMNLAISFEVVGPVLLAIISRRFIREAAFFRLSESISNSLLKARHLTLIPFEFCSKQVGLIPRLSNFEFHILTIPIPARN